MIEMKCPDAPKKILFDKHKISEHKIDEKIPLSF